MKALLVMCVLGLGLVAGCGQRIQEVNFPVKDPDGKTHETKKFWGYTGANDAAANQAFALIQKGQVDDAFALMTDATNKEPNKAYNHYNLALLYEMRADWANANVQIDEALKLQGGNSTFNDEKSNIEWHLKGK